MNSLYIILDTHTDLGLNDLLSNNIAWIKENFSVILMESIPNTLMDEHAVDYMFKALSTGFDCSDCVKIKIISREEGEFLKSPYINDMTREEFVERRIELINKIMPVSADTEHWMRVLGSFKRCQFYFHCLNEDIKLIGMERPDYRPQLFQDLYLRDKAMFENIVTTLNQSLNKPILAITGASHAINLIPNLCRIGQFSCHFIRLVTDSKYISSHSPFEQFRVNVLSKWTLGYAQEFHNVIISTTLPLEEQLSLLNALINNYSGCALPCNIEQNLETGLKKIHAL